MDWKLHLIVGLIFSLAVLGMVVGFGIKASIFSLYLIVFTSLLSSIFPDFDLQKSKARNFFSIFLSFIISLLYILLFPQIWYYSLVLFVSLYFLLKNLRTKHKGLFHTFKFSLFFSFLLFLILSSVIEIRQSFYLFLISLLSYNLHLLLDRK